MSPADVATGFLNVCGGLISLMFVAGGVGAIVITIRHRLIHRRLGLPMGTYSAICPQCLEDQARRTLPWTAFYARDQKRKQLKREEFDSGRR